MNIGYVLVHRLRIWITWDTPKQYDSLIMEGELVRGIDYNCIAHITNIGEDRFPGGTMSPISIVYSSHTAITESENKIIAPLEKDGNQIIRFNLKPNQDGWAWIKMSITSNDVNPIQYFQTLFKYETPSTGIWQNGVLILNREKLEIIKSINKLESKLKKDKSVNG